MTIVTMIRAERSEVRIVAGARVFFSSPKRPGWLWAHPISYSAFRGYRGYFPYVQWPELEVDHSPPFGAKVLSMRGATIPLFPLYTVMVWKATVTLAFLYYLHISLHDLSSACYGVCNPSAFVFYLAPDLTLRVSTTLIERQ